MCYWWRPMREQRRLRSRVAGEPARARAEAQRPAKPRWRGRATRAGCVRVVATHSGHPRRGRPGHPGVGGSTIWARGARSPPLRASRAPRRRYPPDARQPHLGRGRRRL